MCAVSGSFLSLFFFYVSAVWDGFRDGKRADDDGPLVARPLERRQLAPNIRNAISSQNPSLNLCSII